MARTARTAFAHQRITRSRRFGLTRKVKQEPSSMPRSKVRRRVLPYVFTVARTSTERLNRIKNACWDRPNQSVGVTPRQSHLAFAVVARSTGAASLATGASSEAAIAYVFGQDHTCFSRVMRDPALGLTAHLRRSCGLRDDAQGLFVEAVAVHPRHRGQGLCRPLMRRVILHTRRNPLFADGSKNYLYLLVEAYDNDRVDPAARIAACARQCYGQAGFRLIQTLPDGEGDGDGDGDGAPPHVWHPKNDKRIAPYIDLYDDPDYDTRAHRREAYVMVHTWGRRSHVT